MVNDKDKMVVTETRPMGSSIDPHAHVHERSDVDIRTLLISIGLLALVVLATCLAMWGLFRVYEASAVADDKPPSPVADPNPLPPEPRLQSHPPKDMQQMRHETDSALKASGTVDGHTRIPIDRAIDIMADRTARGVGGRDTAAPVAPAAPLESTPSGGTVTDSVAKKGEPAAHGK